MFITRR